MKYSKHSYRPSQYPDVKQTLYALGSFTGTFTPIHKS